MVKPNRQRIQYLARQSLRFTPKLSKAGSHPTASCPVRQQEAISVPILTGETDRLDQPVHENDARSAMTAMTLDVPGWEQSPG
jgi:hypothetical protein